MIKLPKDVNKTMKTLESAGFEAFAVGECVRESLLGNEPYGWDIATSAKLGDLKNLFPEAKVLSEKFNVVRLEYVESVFDKDGDLIGEEGVIIDVAAYRKPDGSGIADSIEEDLERRDFTLNAIADSPNKVVDPYGGRDDVRKKLIRTVGETESALKANPVLMIRALRLVAETGFDLHKEIFDVISANYELLEKVEVKTLRDEFTDLMNGSYAGKAFSMVLESRVISVILGKESFNHLTKREMSDLVILSQNIDKTQHVPDRRLGLMYSVIEKKRALPALERLQYEGDTLIHLTDAVCDMAKLYFVAQKPKLKSFIYEKGMDRYNYMTSLEKAQRIVYEYFSDTKIQSRMYMMEEIRAYKEPIFPEDLVIDANDLIEAGICTPDEDIDKLLGKVVEEIHMHPKKEYSRGAVQISKTL